MVPNSRLALAGYFVAAYLGLVPLFDAVTPYFPARMGEAAWRYALFGVISNDLLIPLVALVAAVVAARFGASWRAERVVGWIAAIAALLMAICAVTFLLAYFSAASTLAPALQRAAVPVTIVATLKYALGTLAAALLARAALAAPRRAPAGV